MGMFDNIACKYPVPGRVWRRHQTKDAQRETRDELQGTLGSFRGVMQYYASND